MSDSSPGVLSLAEAVSRFEGPLVRYAARLLGDVERARDVAQDTFLRLCREDAESVNGHLAPWLFTVCRRRALDVLAKENRMRTLEPSAADACVSREENHAAALERRDTLQQALAALDALPTSQQEVIRLKFQNGLSYREISEVTGLSISNVGYLIHIGLKALRERLAEEGP